MIITKIIGGLGNQMFQYAVGRHLSIKNNTTLKLDIHGFTNYELRKYDLGHFNILEDIATPEDLSNVVFPSDSGICKVRKFLKGKITKAQRINHIKEQNLNFQPDILNIGDNNYLDGYWQSEEYFADIEDTIKKEFSLKSQPDPINETFVGKITDCESVSIHIRRGDYISNPKTAQVHGFIGLEYYQKAINIVLNQISDPHFFVFSDEPEWAIRNIKSDAKITFIKHNGLKNFEDMRLMSNCKHHIIANSTFSWWGAWLSRGNDKIVIAPKKWFANREYSNTEIIPSNWLQI